MSDKVEKDSAITEVVDIDKNLSPKHSKLGDRQSQAEKAKAWIVKALVIIFGSTIGCCFVLMAIDIIFSSSSGAEFKDTVTLILFAETIIVGTVLGFYFGDRSKF